MAARRRNSLVTAAAGGAEHASLTSVDGGTADPAVILASPDRFSGGTSIKTDPYVISTMDDLKEIAEDITSVNSAFYVLASD